MGQIKVILDGKEVWILITDELLETPEIQALIARPELPTPEQVKAVVGKLRWEEYWRGHIEDGTCPVCGGPRREL